MESRKTYNINKDYDLLKEVTLQISNQSLKNWAYNYLNGHMKHYSHVVTKVLSLNSLEVVKVLEIGAVPGHISTILKKLNYEIEIVDIDPGRVKEVFSVMKIPTYKVDIEKKSLPLEDNTYDLVLMNEVLEHLRLDPLKIFAEVKRVCRPNGFFYISIPNITPLMRFRFLFGFDYTDDICDEFEKIKKIGHMGHFRIYSHSEIDKILRSFDFTVLDVSYGGNLHNAGNQLLCRLFQYCFRQRMKKQLHIIAQKR